jgi:hypothetical protein
MLRPQAHDGSSSGFYPHEGGGDHARRELIDSGSASTCMLALCSDWSKLAGDHYELCTVTSLVPFLICCQR